MKLGNASYTIYLSHFLLLQVSFYLLTKYFHLPIVALNLMVVSIVLSAGVAGYIWVERPLLRLSRGRLFRTNRKPSVISDALAPPVSEKS